MLAAGAAIDTAAGLLAALPPDPSDRAFNSARLWLARAYFDAGDPRRAFDALGGAQPRDSFAREHQAWLALCLGDADRADSALLPFLSRGDHRTDRNLSNFLHGAALVARGREEEAQEVFCFLRREPWPRTWTLGSHYAAGRLGSGDLQAYMDGAFPWEKSQLRSHATLLARARGRELEPEESLLQAPA